MPGEKHDRRVNPFVIAGTGLLLLFAGLALKTHVASFLEEAERQGALPRPRDQDHGSASSTDRGARSFRQRLHWEVAGQLVFFLGLGLVVAGGVIWYRQAQQPDPEPESMEDDPAGSNGLSSTPPRSPYSS